MALKGNIKLDKEFRTAQHGRAKEVLKKNPKASAKEIKEALVVIPVDGIPYVGDVDPAFPEGPHENDGIQYPKPGEYQPKEDQYKEEGANEPLLRDIIDRVTAHRENRLFLVALEKWLSDAGL